MWLMQLPPNQLREQIGRNKVRNIAAAAIAGVTWLAAFVLLAKLHGPVGREWMLPLAALFLVGGLGVLVLPVYVLNRRYCPRCTTCGAYIYDETLVDVGGVARDAKGR